MICDDNRCFGESLRNRILHFEPESTVNVFRTAGELTAYLDENADITDCIFMDIELDGGVEGRRSGIEIISGIVNNYGGIKTVYVTGYPEAYVQSVFECPPQADPIAFLVKPVQDKYLINALKKLKDRTSLERDVPSLPVKQSGAVVFIPLSDIIYVSSSAHKIIIHTADADTQYYGKLSQVEESLGSQFTKCHKSFIVNCKHIKKINGWKEAVMSDGSVCPVSRSRREMFREAVVLSGAVSGTAAE